jgi:hypothetical protein
MRSRIILTSTILSVLLFAPILEARQCFAPIAGDAQPFLQATIEVSLGNKIFAEKKCTVLLPYYKGHNGITAANCEANKDLITLDKGYAPFGIMFQGYKSTPKKDIVSYHWKIKNSNGAVLKEFDAWNAAYVFEQPGTYTAQLTVTSSGGSTSTASKTITVWPRGGKTYYVDSAIGDDRFNGLSRTVAAGCNPSIEVKGTCSGPWKTATRAFNELAPYNVNASTGAAYKTDDFCKTQEIWEVRRYSDGLVYSLYRDSTNYSADVARDAAGNLIPPDNIPVCVTLNTKRTTVLQPGDKVLFRRGQSFALDTTIVTPSNITRTIDGVVYHYEQLIPTAATSIGHWSTAIGVHYGAYGDGPAPLINNTGRFSTTAITWQGVGAFHFAMTDLAFDLESLEYSIFQSRPKHGNRAALLNAYEMPINFVFKRLSVKRFGQGIIMSTNSGETTRGDGFFLFDSTFYDSNVVHFFTQNAYKDVSIVGNSFDYAGNHIGYTSLDSSLIYDNKMSRPAFGRAAFRISGSNLPGDANTWIGYNIMEGWIDPRTMADDGPEFSANGKSWNFSLVNISPNNANETANMHVLHDIVLANNTISGCMNCVSLGNLENFHMFGNTITSADIESRSSRVEISTDFSRRPSKNFKIFNNTFTDTGIHPFSGGAFFGLANYSKLPCDELANHTGIEIYSNTFNMSDPEKKILMHTPLAQYGTTGLLSLDAAEAQLPTKISLTDNAINTATPLAAMLQVGGDGTVQVNDRCDGNFVPYCSSVSALGKPTRFYNATSPFWVDHFDSNSIQ